MEPTPIGTIISTPDSPSTTKLAFIVTGSARKGQFVMLETQEGKLIARISEIIKTNRYFERAESVQEFERSGKPLTELFPSERWEYLVAEAVPLGVYSSEKLMRSAFPASPGAKVFNAENSILSIFFGLDLEKGLHLGTVEHHNMLVKLNMTRLLQKHFAILAQSGAGKSYLTSCLIEELLDRKPEDGQVATVVIDTHGEYIGFAEDKNYKDRTDVILGRDFRIGVPGLSAGMIAEIMPHMTSVQKRELNKFLAVMNDENRGKVFDFRDVLNKLESSEIKSTTRDILYTLIYELDSTGLFSGYDNPSLQKLTRPGHLTVIDISDMVSLKEKQIIVTYLGQKLFNARRSGAIPPFAFIVEEAHNFCLSEDTEILTMNGWKKYNEIEVGDPIFSYNKEIDKFQNASIERIIIKDHDGELIRLHNQDSIDALLTEDHRVLCNVRTTGKDRKWKYSQLRFISAKDLPSGLKIPIVAEMEHNSRCNIDDDLIKILGWIITDGYLHIFKKDNYSCFEISQSESKGKILQEMKEVVSRRFPESKVYFRKKSGHRFPDKRYVKETEENIFYLGKKATEEIRIWLGNSPHRIPRKLLENSSIEQLKILFDALVQGDGTIYHSKNKHKRIVFYAGHDNSLADDFQELCVRLGLSAVKTKWAYGQTNVAVSFKRKFASLRKITKEHYSGKVWDITVKNGAFVARRNGKVFITGNCPEGTSREGAISRRIIEKIAREGRKFHACLGLISQRPINLSTTALSQCNTHIILRVTNPYDLKHIGESSEGLTSDVLGTISSLRVGEALIVGEAVNYPLFLKVRERKSKKNERGIALEQACLNFADGRIQKEKDAKAFM